MRFLVELFGDLRERITLKTVIIVQDRMISTGLLGKVLYEVLGKPLLEYQIEKLEKPYLVIKG